MRRAYHLFDLTAGFVARFMAYVGGALLLALILATCISIVGRELSKIGIGPGPIEGIFELTKIGVAAAAFAFLGWCQYQRGQAAVDLLKPTFGGVGNRLIDVMTDALMLLIAVILTYRLYLGMEKKRTAFFPETTTILEFPVWIAYSFGLVGLTALIFVSLFCVVRACALVVKPDLEAAT